MHEFNDEEGPVDLPVGKIFSKRWKILKKLDDGSCGSVYLVKDLKTRTKAALKAEPNIFIDGSFLKFEVQVLKRMQGRNFVAQLIYAKKKKDYSYVIMTLFGDNLSNLLKQCNNEFTVSTQVRLGIQILYGLKQLHEIGYVHRDVKPSNFAIGSNGPKARVAHLLDFGLAREYVLRSEDKVEMRRPRRTTLFRGTTKYCSASTHSRSEQGRPDDLWSMVYVLAEMRGSLPWDHLRENQEIGKMKMATSDEKLLVKCPPQMLMITEHLRTLDYYKRPDYQLIFDILCQIKDEHKIKYSDPLDWETAGISTTPCKSNFRTATVLEDNDIAGMAVEFVDPNSLPFAAEEFSRNELGF